MRKILTALSFLAIVPLCATAANADDSGLTGSLVSLEANTSSSDLYLSYFGRIFVKNTDGNLDEYRWGGTSCGNRILSDAEVAVLQRAMVTKNMLVVPRSQIGQGNVNCLVGFSFVEKKNLKLFP